MSDNKYEINDVVEELLQVDEIRAKERRVLCRLLDNLSQQEKKYIAIRGMMGKTLGNGAKATNVPSYSVMLSLAWIGEKHILMGSEMDFMKTNIDPETNKLVINEESAEEMKQRAPDWSRQADLSTYLIQEKYHKFGTILAVICPSWVDNPKHDNWGKDGRAIESATKFESLDSAGNIGLLDLNDVQIYALDGQHRIMGIRGIMEIIEGGLQLKNKDMTPKKVFIPKNELLNKLNADIHDLRSLLDEKINIEFVPAVLVGETREEASRRIRSVFVAINEYAKSPDKGETILLSENDGYAIVSRRIGHHHLFLDDKKDTRVNWKNAQISKRESQNIITLQALKTSVMYYVKQYKHINWEPLFSTVAIRPADDELRLVENEMKSILDALANLPIFIQLRAGDPLPKLREFPDDDKPDNRGHILLRPIGFPILFDAISKVLDNGKQSITQLIEKLIVFDRNRGFDAHLPHNIWYLVTYNPNRKNMITKTQNQSLASDLLSYLLEGAEASVREDLLINMVSCRKVTENEWINYDGKTEEVHLSKIDLPIPIRLP